MTVEYVERKITVKLTLGEGDFGDIAPSGSNIGTFEGLRVSANIANAGAPGLSTASVRIWGLSESVMNQFSSLGRPILFERKNTITLLAGDDINGLAQVFFGVIYDAYQSFGDDGAASFDITAQPQLIDLTKPVSPLSYPNGADVGTVMAGLASQMNLKFANYGVQVQLPPGSYFWGTAAAMAETVRKAANCLMVNDGTTLSIFPQGGSLNGQVVLVSPETGLVGYPTLSGYGVKLKVLFNPEITLQGGISLTSSLLNANGTWYPMTIIHELESIMPGGAWFTTLDCARSVGA